jgi:2,5-diketo-D-gluconate reductase A
MRLPLSDGGSIPAIGLGTWPMGDDECERVVAEALELGYRLVDTAYAYGNETGVGRGVRASGVPREDVFVTTKFNRQSHSVAGVRTAFEDSARRLGVDYLDLMLIHWPNPDLDRYAQAWEGLVALREQGLVRHIGTSNFLPEHVDRIIAATGVAPVLDQLQMNPRHQQTEARAYNAVHGIVTQAWSPRGQGNDLLRQPVLERLARAHDCTPAQVVLAWNFAQGVGAVPKSANRRRLAENLAAQDLELDAADIEAINEMDGTEPDVTDPRSFGH